MDNIGGSNEELLWHPGLTDAQVMEAQKRGIYEPLGPEYEQFIKSVGLDLNDLDKVPIEYPSSEFIENEDKLYEMGWHPKLTKEQIIYALEKDISEPVGQEYEMFLRELGLEPIKKEVVFPPPKWPQPKPNPDPEIDFPVFVDPQPKPNPEPGEEIPEIEFPKPKPNPKPEEEIPEFEDPKPKPNPEPGEEIPEFEEPKPKPNPKPDEEIPEFEDPKPKPNPKPDEEIPEHDEPEREKEEEESIKVVRVEKKWENRVSALLLATSLAFTLASGFDMNKPVDVITIEQHNINYTIEEQLREMGYEDKVIEEIIYKFASDYDIDIGSTMDFDDITTVYEYGNITGTTDTIDGKQPITGFCLYSPSDENVRYEYSFYEDRALDGTPDRTNVDGIDSKDGVSLDEFLAQLDASNYNLDDIRFSLHFANMGWVDFSDLIKVDQDTRETVVQQMVEICKKGATYEGTVEDVDVDFIRLVNDNNEEVWVPITDEDDNLLEPGSHVIGSDGKEYVISRLEEEKVTDQALVDNEEKSRLSWNILDCELAVGLAPLLAAVGFAVASKIRNERYKKDPKFFEFETDPDYQNFKRDFEKAREEYRDSSKFGQVLKRVFYGEEKHIATDLTEEQIEEMYTTIKNTNNADYVYNPTDQIRFREGQVYAFHQDGTYSNITDTVSHIGKDNTGGIEGRLTDEITEEYGGGHKR